MTITTGRIDLGAHRARVRLWTAVAFALGGSLSACQRPQPQRVLLPVEIAPPAPPVIAPVPPPQPEKSKPRPRPAAKAPLQPVTPAPDATPAVIIQVIGMSQDDLRTALGEPTERIDQGPGQAWIYKAPQCTVEVLFFLDVTRNGYYALDRKISVSGDPAERACYAEIQNARRH